MTEQTTTDRISTAIIEADPVVPSIHITRDFKAGPAQVIRAHIDPDLVVQWLGPKNRTISIDHWGRPHRR